MTGRARKAIQRRDLDALTDVIDGLRRTVDTFRSLASRKQTPGG
jgi:hypothetical protein